MFSRAIEYFHRIVVEPSGYPRTVEGFQDFLTATGIQHFSAREMTRPNHRDKARDAGFEIFLPEHDWWARGAALASAADALRELVDEPVPMRNWWRPPEYNDAVGGADSSDHVSAHAVDLDYGSQDSRRRAEHRLREYASDAPWLELSLGLGGRTTHVGIGSPRGARDWFYDSYTP